MTEYTPTTGKVRNCYSSGRPVLDNDGTSPSEREAEFDRWLDQVKADAWDAGYLAHRQEMNRASILGLKSRILNPYRKETP